MPSETANTADSFEIIRITRSMRRLKPDPVPNELIRDILEAGVWAPASLPTVWATPPFTIQVPLVAGATGVQAEVQAPAPPFCVPRLPFG